VHSSRGSARLRLMLQSCRRPLLGYTIRHVGLALAIGIGSTVGTSIGNAADYPTRSVRVIIPFSAGGAPDIVMRVLAQALSDKWKQSVVVENRPGGNTFVGTTAVTRSAPDG
jgi:tripartite-type tricarboxylate transporter receptor subunit TctC